MVFNMESSVNGQAEYIGNFMPHQGGKALRFVHTELSNTAIVAVKVLVLFWYSIIDNFFISKLNTSLDFHCNKMFLNRQKE